MNYYLTYSPRFNKRFMLLTPSQKKIHFGAKNGSTYIDHGDKLKKNNYIKRHSKLNEDWNNIETPGALSMYLLWGKYPDLNKNIKDVEKTFGIRIYFIK